jgi:iron complex transport system permease protein
MKKTHGTGIRFLILALLFALVFFGSFWVGRYDVSPLQTLRILADWLLRTLSRGRLALTQTWQVRAQAVVLNVRLPRVAAAALVGAALSTAGCAYQGMFRNPMVSPDLLGASTGAGFGAALALLLGLGYGAVTGLSFTFGLLAVLLAYLISRVSKIQTTLAMVLAGVMISSLFTSGTSFIKLVADPTDQLPAITYWLMGSLTATKVRDVQFAAWPILAGLVPLWLLRWRVNLLTVSEAEARSMGVHTGRLRVVVVLCATLMTAGSVAISGMIGWVGLVIPHFGRMIFGQDYRKLLPASSLLGAVFLMVVDNLARTVTTSEIPLGILTSFVGAPVFLYLILSGGTQREH